jgi:DNA-binding transcriptional MerR regulator
MSARSTQRRGFALGEVVRTINTHGGSISAGDVSNWLRLGYLSTKQHEGSGKHRTYSLRDAIHIAALHHMIGSGVKLSAAAQCLKLLDLAKNKKASQLYVMFDAMRGEPRAVSRTEALELPVCTYVNIGRIVDDVSRGLGRC